MGVNVLMRPSRQSELPLTRYNSIISIAELCSKWRDQLPGSSEANVAGSSTKQVRGASLAEIGGAAASLTELSSMLPKALTDSVTEHTPAAALRAISVIARLNQFLESTDKVSPGQVVANVTASLGTSRDAGASGMTVQPSTVPAYTHEKCALNSRFWSLEYCPVDGVAELHDLILWWLVISHGFGRPGGRFWILMQRLNPFDDSPPPDSLSSQPFYDITEVVFTHLVSLS